MHIQEAYCVNKGNYSCYDKNKDNLLSRSARWPVIKIKWSNYLLETNGIRTLWFPVIHQRALMTNYVHKKSTNAGTPQIGHCTGRHSYSPCQSRALSIYAPTTQSQMLFKKVFEVQTLSRHSTYMYIKHSEIWLQMIWQFMCLHDYLKLNQVEILLRHKKTSQKTSKIACILSSPNFLLSESHF